MRLLFRVSADRGWFQEHIWRGSTETHVAFMKLLVSGADFSGILKCRKYVVLYCVYMELKSMSFLCFYFSLPEKEAAK